MRYATATIVLALFAAIPAHATGGFNCKTASDPAIALDIGFGHTPGASLFLQRLRVGDENIPVRAPQWWLDGEELRLLLTDEQANERLALVRTRWNEEARAYDGAIEFRGRSHWIRCREG